MNADIETVKQLQETPERAVQELAFFIGYVRLHLSPEQEQCARDCLTALALKAGVFEEVIKAALR